MLRKIFVLICLFLSAGLMCYADDNTNISTTHSEMTLEDENVEKAYKYYVLDRIDGPDIPDNVRQYAKENNCINVVKKYYWSEKIFQNKGGVYYCSKNNRKEYIYDNGEKLRFARMYEKHKFRKVIFGD